MSSISRTPVLARLLLAPLAALMLLGAGLASAAEVKVSLSGAEVVPPVPTEATGSGNIVVNDDKSVSGSVTLSKLAPAFAAHIHQGEAGKNGPPIVWLEKKDENTWTVVPGAKLTDEQYAAYKAGNLYVQFHTDKYRPGEIRGQIKP